MASQYHNSNGAQLRTQLFASTPSYTLTTPKTSFASSRTVTPNNGYTPSPYSTPPPQADYSSSMLSQLESQSDEKLEGLTSKVRMLKDISLKIGDEVRDSGKLIQNLESSFGDAQQRLKGTWKRMVIMADKSGVGWRAWLGFFAFIFFVFFLVWVR